MGHPRRLAGIFILLSLTHSGCALYRGAKLVMSPVGTAADLVVASGNVAASTAGAVGSTAGGAVVRTSRVAISGAGTATRVSAATMRATGTVAGAGVEGAGALTGGSVRASTALGSATVSTSGRVAASGVRGTGRVVVSGIDTSTQVTSASVRATGDLTAQTLQNLSRMSQAGMVTFVDFSTGSVVRIPWRAGLNVYGGGALANVRTADRALAVVREGRLVFNTLRALAEARSLPLKAGDVLRLAGTAGGG